MYSFNEKLVYSYGETTMFEFLGPGLQAEMFFDSKSDLINDLRPRIPDILNLFEEVFKAGKQQKAKEILSLLTDKEKPKTNEYKIIELRHPKRFTIYGAGLPLLNQCLVFNQQNEILSKLVKIFETIFYNGKNIKAQEIRMALTL